MGKLTILFIYLFHRAPAGSIIRLPVELITFSVLILLNAKLELLN